MKNLVGNLDITCPSAIKTFLSEFESELNSQFFETSIEELQKSRAEMFDCLLTRLWHHFEICSERISLNAVGGYGRGCLHPRSDLDLCILFDGKLSDEDQTKLSNFLTRLWDFGVDIGHAVRPIADNIEAARNDITIATNLLDIRSLTGASHHSLEIQNILYSNDIWTSKTFFECKIQEQLERHNKAKNTALYLEPNIKNNPGGMRDVQTIIWVARKHFSVADAEALKSHGFLKSDEYSELRESHDFICRIRWALHTVSNRAEERLLFDHQLAVAEFMKFGYGDNAQLAVEKMMRQLFRAMTRVRVINQMICDVFRREILQGNETQNVIQIDEHFSINNGMIQANYEEVFYDKSHVIRMFKLIAEQDEISSIAPETVRLLRQTRRGLLGELQDYHGCRKEFLKIIKHPKGLQLAFSLMHRYGILASYFPQWRAIEGQMQFDMHNAYTVDEHAFKLIQHLDSFVHLPKNNALVRSIYKQSPVKHVLTIAGLCHDLSGKQSHEANDVSAVHAREFAALHELKKSEVELVSWLVEHQELLISTTQAQDIHDPDVIKKVATTIRSEAKLNALYCFTVADLMATNDQVWNEWQESLLNELYFSLRTALKQGIENVFEQRTVIRENKADAILALNEQGFSNEEVNALWTNLPSNFFSANQLHEIIEFSMQILSAEHTDKVVSLSEDSNLGCTNLLVYTQDRNMLFVDLFNTLSSLKIKVKAAQILKTKNAFVLEVIKILDHNDDVINDELRVKQVTKKVLDVVSGEKVVRKPAKPKFVENFENDPTIEFLPTPKKGKTLLRINALDDPRFMERICQVFKHQRLTIHSAKISTLGECSENVFLISTKNNEAITHQEKSELLSVLANKIA